MTFLCSGIRFASVDISNDVIKMKKSFNIEIPAACHIDIQEIFRPRHHERTSMAHMAVDLIDDYYADMKTKIKNHNEWETTPLHGKNIDYAATDAFVAYSCTASFKSWTMGSVTSQHQLTLVMMMIQISYDDLWSEQEWWWLYISLWCSVCLLWSG